MLVHVSAMAAAGAWRGLNAVQRALARVWEQLPLGASNRMPPLQWEAAAVGSGSSENAPAPADAAPAMQLLLVT